MYDDSIETQNFVYKELDFPSVSSFKNTSNLPSYHIRYTITYLLS